MREMTRAAETARIHAPFDGALFRFKDDSARLVQKDGARFMSIQSREFGDHTYRVTRVIGGRYREDYAGVEVPATQAMAPAGGAQPGHYRAGAELVLPVSYVFETRSFRLKGYSVMVGERPGLRAGGVWNQTCVFCHNTTPYFDSTWGELLRAGAPAYQGGGGRRSAAAARPPLAFEVTDGHAASRRWRTRDRDRGARRRGAAAERRRRRRAARARHRRAAHARFRRPSTSSRSASAASPATAAAARTSTSRACCPTSRPGARSCARSHRRAGPRSRAPSGSTAPARAATRCCSRATRSPGRAAPRRRQPGRQLDHLGRGARLPAGRLRAPDVVRHLPRSARRRPAR